MKKFLLLSLSAFLLLSITASAQIKKGSVLLGGGISGQQSKSENGSRETNYSSFSFYPSVGLAIKDNTIAGVNFFYSHSKSQESPNQSGKGQGYGGGLFYRKYLPLGKGFSLFGEGSVFYQFLKSTTELNSSTPSYYIQKNQSIGLVAYPGLAYAVSKRFNIEVAINNFLSVTYSNNKRTTSFNETIKGSDFSFDANLSPSKQFYIGFRIVLGK
jgi:opacity protein-like surface antigen